jgi:hypothetical protein
MVLLLYLSGRPVFDRWEIYVYAFIALTYLFGWFDGSGAERKSNRIHIAT